MSLVGEILSEYPIKSVCVEKSVLRMRGSLNIPEVTRITLTSATIVVKVGASVIGSFTLFMIGGEITRDVCHNQ